ncbi:MAG: STAS domain-containing protein [Calditrichae bacterium]|nr:STAS domain-containing protein [Calditrichota bacterium]MCB9058456.1 STAS domain-containing protein [Calditrichia bacterium]
MLKINQEFVRNLVILELKGFLNTRSDLDVFNQSIERLINAGKKFVILDLYDVPWINSLGLGNIIAAMSSLRHRDGELKIANPSPKVNMLLTMTSTILILETFNTVREAVDSFENKK